MAGAIERSSTVLGLSPLVTVSQRDERHKKPTVMSSPLYISDYFNGQTMLPVVSCFICGLVRILSDLLKLSFDNLC